jgi:hypothetical protein
VLLMSINSCSNHGFEKAPGAAAQLFGNGEFGRSRRRFNDGNTVGQAAAYPSSGYFIRIHVFLLRGELWANFIFLNL